MNGTRVTSEDTSRISTYIGVVVAIALLAGLIYFFLFARAKTKEVIGFDPNRPIPSDSVLRARLKPDQYHVVRENGTETAFRNEYWNNERPGIYVDVIDGEPLFSSADKFDGGTGRPTFTKPIDKSALVSREDDSYDMKRIEIRTKRSDAHLGHWFADPTSPTGERYAVNSGALRFIPKERMEAEHYGEYLSLVDKK
jgi:peptide methionine sulfoxide reductase msrA/msrB